jgi:acyl dehydratase
MAEDLMEFEADEKIGKKLGVSPWLLIDQTSIDQFGDVTKDPDPQHVNPEWSKANSPWGTTIAFGFQTLSMLTHMMAGVIEYDNSQPTIHGYNYGLDYVRFMAPVKAGSRIRGHFTLKDVQQRKPGQTKVIYHVEVEIEGEDKPAMVADWVNLVTDPEGRDQIDTGTGG